MTICAIIGGKERRTEVKEQKGKKLGASKMKHAQGSCFSKKLKDKREG